MRRAPAVFAALLFGALEAGPALAFSDPVRFAAPAAEGGGAGRHFTGTPEDGFGCGVCHRGALPPSVTLEGFPTRTEPGARYEVTVRWASPELSHALHLELVGATGRHPAVELVNAADPPSEERCEGDPEGAPAVYSVDLGSRRVLGVQDCGATSLSFSFVAPAEPLYLAFGAVRSDGSATPEGDGVLEHRSRVLPGVAVGPGDLPACAASGAGPGAAPSAPLGSRGTTVGIAAGLFLAARRRRRPAPSARRAPDGGRSRPGASAEAAPSPAVLAAGAAALVSLPLAATGCFAPDTSDEYILSSGADEPPAHLFEPPDAGAPDASDACASAPVTDRALHFRVRTSSVGGKFAPRNVGAIWIEDGAGAFVKTLERWGITRAKWLLTFEEASAGNVVDAITSATKIAHETHEVTWDTNDVAGCPAPEGPHVVRLELTDRSGPGVTHAIPFELVGSPADLFPEETANFHDMALEWR